MNPVEIIIKKRNGIELNSKEIKFIIEGYLSGIVTDYQMSAFLMSVYFSGMTSRETSILTETMLHSGEVLDLSSIPGIKVDKHSTGGVGDKVSLIIAPIAAAAGVPVPMISGRGLGHSGGTLDKLEAIPGFRTDLSIKEYVEALQKIGAVLIGQTKEIAPADKKIYALRDVTGTVESIPLICASIMSKKLAEGIDGLVLDVKTGGGAFMKTLEDSERLALGLKSIADAFNKKTIAFITSMDQPLGFAVGNWLEVVESVECLKGKDVSDLMEVSHNLAGAMIYLGEKASSIEEGVEISKEQIKNGCAYKKFLEITANQGGNISFIKEVEKYPKSKNIVKLKSKTVGYVKSINAFEIGMAGIELGAGRMKHDDIIDPKAGLLFSKKVGDEVNVNDTLVTLFTDKDDVQSTLNRVEKSIEISNLKPEKIKMIKKIIS
ncbi:MAG: thymidine phosphorylase [Bacteroidetes bacterium]|nr:thymidine phosphorylase [Bacteroidota bacterium]MBU2584755.1 thymidine phosphorylase [Bacteroidota bacterium]